jgi:hypothetical protein
MSQAGLTAADAEPRLGFGRIEPARDEIFERIIKGTFGFKDAARQVKDWPFPDRCTACPLSAAGSELGANQFAVLIQARHGSYWRCWY